MPGSLLSRYSPLPEDSVPLCWVTRYCSGESLETASGFFGNVGIRFSWLRVTQRPEARANLRDKMLRLLPGREVGALVELVVVDELWIRLLSPTRRRLVDLFGESAHGDGDLHAPHIEEAAGWKIMPGIPVEACRGDRGVRQPIERDVVEHVVPRQPFRLTIE